MICRKSIGEPLRVLSFAAFRRTCQAKWSAENGEYKRFTAGCAGCATGEAIKKGRLRELPENVGLIEGGLMEGKMRVMSAAEVRAEAKEADWPVVAVLYPAGVDMERLTEAGLLTDDLTLVRLRPFWEMPVLEAKKTGVCPNCRRSMPGHGAGLCAGCYFATYKSCGVALLQALRSAADRFWTPPAAASSDEQRAILEGCVDAMGVEGVFFKDLPDLIRKVVEQRDMFEEIHDEVAHALEAEPNDNLSLLASRRMAILGALDCMVVEMNAEIASLKAELGQVDGTGAPPACPAGYEALGAVLNEALLQAATGKGRDRHADGRPFDDQPIMRETYACGLGFPAGQARKKILEAVRCCQDHPERAVADLLGAINYIAALIIGIRGNATAEQAA